MRVYSSELMTEAIKNFPISRSSLRVLACKVVNEDGNV